MAKKPKKYTTVQGYEGRFEVVEVVGKYRKKVWAKRPGESEQYCFPIEMTDLTDEKYKLPCV